MTDFNEQIMRRLDRLDHNINTIISSTSANGAVLTTLQNDLREYRQLNQQRFDKINEKFLDDEERLNEHENRLVAIETKAATIYRMLAILGTVVLGAVGWLTNVWHRLFDFIFS